MTGSRYNRLNIYIVDTRPSEISIRWGRNASDPTMDLLCLRKPELYVGRVAHTGNVVWHTCTGRYEYWRYFTHSTHHFEALCKRRKKEMPVIVLAKG